MQIRRGRSEKTVMWEWSSGLHRKAIPAPKLELGAISRLAFNVCSWQIVLKKSSTEHFDYKAENAIS